MTTLCIFVTRPSYSCICARMSKWQWMDFYMKNVDVGHLSLLTLLPLICAWLHIRALEVVVKNMRVK